MLLTCQTQQFQVDFQLAKTEDWKGENLNYLKTRQEGLCKAVKTLREEQTDTEYQLDKRRSARKKQKTQK